MRFKIFLTACSRKKFLPVDYQYLISSWIYRRIADGDNEFAGFLHEQGYMSGNKKFKLFNFSPLDIRPYKLYKERGVFELLSDTVSVTFSCALPDIATPLIKGIFQNAEASLGDKISRVDFNVGQLQLLPEPDFEETMSYRAGSLCVVTRPPQGDEKYGQYLFPGDKGFTEQLTGNLLTKYQTAGKVVAGMENEDQPEVKVEHSPNYRAKKIKVKSFTPQETDVKGSLFDCTITAPPEVHKLIWQVGLGEKNSMGCGWVEEKKS